MRNAAMYAPTMSEVDRRQFEDSYEVWQWNKRVERQYRIDGLKRERESISDEINNELNSNVYGRGYGGMLNSAQRLTELTNRLNSVEEELGILYKEQLMDYRVEGDYYISNVDGIEIRMSKYNFSPQAQKAGMGNTPINLATGGMDPRAVLVLIDNAHAVNVDAVEVSSLWRNWGSHRGGRGIDITSISINGQQYNFNNVNGETQGAFQAALFNLLMEDSRVSQVLDPWHMYGLVSRPEYHVNDWREQDPTTYNNANNYWLHRNHLHFLIN
ncbi:hypothetical protein [Thermospira aquatica]|uniref:Uncharacterized protein n=1 Tax=Thermospira aquatica TaxID=2828656 RepID=A0AAX3BB69_9SPIR|nr:hypothetical protein [Thermospira aquatica]URA09424.1 hypothetical protein KDW03_07975 [Thermospira aquatica]